MQRAWHYLQLSLSRNDLEEGDWVYRKTTMDTMLELNQSARLPHWLVAFFLVSVGVLCPIEAKSPNKLEQEKQPDYLVRLCLKYNRLQEALQYSIRMVKEV